MATLKKAAKKAAPKKTVKTPVPPEVQSKKGTEDVNAFIHAVLETGIRAVPANELVLNREEFEAVQNLLSHLRGQKKPDASLVSAGNTITGLGDKQSTKSSALVTLLNKLTEGQYNLRNNTIRIIMMINKLTGDNPDVKMDEIMDPNPSNLLGSLCNVNAYIDYIGQQLLNMAIMLEDIAK